MSRFRLVAPLALAGLVGCGSDEDRITLVPVTGTVTLNRKPLADARINFAPADGNKHKTPGVDSTGPDGGYKLMFKGRSGVAPGKYKVSISPPADPSGGGDSNVFKDDPLQAQFAAEARQSSVAKKKDVGAQSEFEREVSEKGDVLDFDVKASSSSATKAN